MRAQGGPAPLNVPRAPQVLDPAIGIAGHQQFDLALPIPKDV